MPQGDLQPDRYIIEAAFAIRGDSIPLDHGYALYGALSRQPIVGPWLRETEDVAIHPIRGHFVGNSLLKLGDKSRLRLRLPAAALPQILPLTGSRGQALNPAKRQVEQLFRPMRRLQADNLLPALKAALIVADAAGSGLAREHRDIKTWISATFDGAPVLKRADIEDEVLGKRIAEIEVRRRINEPGYVFRYHDFQDGAALLPDRALLIAPCGLGRTLAAWRWIGSRLDAQPASRVLFLYPTRATATEGFKDCVSHAPETDAILLSATAAYELKDMFANPDDPRGERCGRSLSNHRRASVRLEPDLLPQSLQAGRSQSAHREVIDRFARAEGSLIAVTTQVCMASLLSSSTSSGCH